ncbi:MAG: Tol-Pal system protein TolB, partial [Ensifer sp. SSB1]|nr:Tol-Pal system protein TolB [Ensifer sp. SSB1]
MIKVSLFRALMVAAGMLAAVVAATPANAVVEININKGNVEPLPIAITDFL